MKNGLLLLLAALLVSPLAAGIDLPGDSFQPGWQRSGETRLFKKIDLFNHIDGAAELFLEFGFEELLLQRYGKGEQEITLELFRMQNPTAALGIYLCKCGKETPIAGVAARNSGDAYQFTIVKGSYFLQVNNFSGSEGTLPAMKTAANHVLKQMPAGAGVPLLEILPSRGLIPGSKFIIRGPYGLQKIYTFGAGDILLLQGTIFAAAADYKFPGGEEYTLILVPYPDQTAARAAFGNLVSHLDPYLEIVTRKEQAFVFKDFKGRFGLVERCSHLIKIKVHLAAQPALKNR